MASAKRLIELRQLCLNSSRIAEISVPAWPIPIHQTKLMIAKPQATGCVIAQMPTPFRNSQVTATSSTVAPPPATEEGEPAQRRVRREHNARDLLGDRPEGLARRDDSVFPGLRVDARVAGFHFAGRHRDFNPSPVHASPASLRVPGSDSKLRPRTASADACSGRQAPGSCAPAPAVSPPCSPCRSCCRR